MPKSKPTAIEKEKTMMEKADCYWEVVDADDDYDGYLHIVSTYDGSEIKIDIQELLKEIGQHYEK